VLDGFIGRDIDEDRVELHQAAGAIGLYVARQPHRKAALGAPPSWPSAPTQGRNRIDHAARHQAPDDAPDGGIGDRKAFRPHDRAELGAPPHRIILAQPLDRTNQRARPILAANTMRP
jgi:hypothetical protein